MATRSLHNVLQLSSRIYSGGEPHGETAFAELAKLGVTTVVSVDGATPDVELARQYALRYVHIPIGYDGVNDAAGKSLARLVNDLKGPFYIHCHHGRHRGPAAAAIACVAAGEATADEAVRMLEQAGTSKSYAGLWRDVRQFKKPATGEVLPELVERAKVESLAVAMATMDRAKDNLEICRTAEWKSPASHPDLAPEQEALLLKEGLRESNRNLGANYDAQFRSLLADAERLAESLETALKRRDPEAASRHFQSLNDACKHCHKRHRD